MAVHLQIPNFPSGCIAPQWPGAANSWHVNNEWSQENALTNKEAIFVFVMYMWALQKYHT